MENQPQFEHLAPSPLEAVSRAEIDCAIATAKRFPMHAPNMLAKVKQDMITFATLDQETAESCFYTLPRGGKTIRGPSVRLAEIALNCYGNLRAGARIIHTDTEGENPHVVVQAVVMDLERNISVGIEKRRRIVKKKTRLDIDEDDINLATNACIAIAYRDAVFKVIPGALIKPVYDAARHVAIGDAKTMADRRIRCIETFAKMGVVKDRILLRIEKESLEEITAGDLETLLGLRNAIKEGEISIDEAFPAVVAGVTAGKQQHAPETPAAARAAQGGQILPSVAAPEKVPGRAGPAPDEKIPGKEPERAPAPEVASGGAVPPGLNYPEEPKTDAKAELPPEPLQPAEMPEKAPEPAQSPGLTGGGAPTGPEPPAKPAFKPNRAESEKLQSLRMVMQETGVSEERLMAHCRIMKFAKPTQVLSDLSETKLTNLMANWRDIATALQPGDTTTPTSPPQS